MTTLWNRRKTARAFARAELIAELRRPQTTIDGRLDGEPKHAEGASLTGFDLSDADLRMAQLQRANLRKAVLSRSKFDGADLSGADLDGAQINNATFKRAKLLDTTFHSADLTGCDFSDATGLSPATVRGASSIRGVKWPEGFTPTEPSVIGPLLH